MNYCEFLFFSETVQPENMFPLQFGRKYRLLESPIDKNNEIVIVGLESPHYYENVLVVDFLSATKHSKFLFENWDHEYWYNVHILRTIG